MKCTSCGLDFREEDARKACRGCPSGSCGRIRCPACGAEMLREPSLFKLIRKIKTWREKRHEAE